MWSRILPPLFLFLVTFLIYLHNLSPSVYGGDVGDMLSAIATRGVPHPSGYPLFTLLGILFSFLPIQQTLAWKVGLISVFSSSFSAVVMYLMIFELLKKRLLAVVTAFTLAFFYTFWLYAEIAEVFALNNLFILLLLYLAILYWKRKKKVILYFLFFFAGLSLSHHEIIVLFFPSLAILVLSVNWKVFLRPVFVGKCLLLFLLGLLPYLYIPIAASFDPPINWMGKPTLENFIRLILRLDYGWEFSHDANLYLRFLGIKTYAMDLFVKLTPAGITMILLGIVWLLSKRQIVLFAALFLGFFFAGPFYVVYGFIPLVSSFKIGVLERFYMISALPLLVFFPFGMVFVVDTIFTFLKKIFPLIYKKSYYREIFLSLFMLIPFFLLISNFAKTNLTDVWIGDYLGEDVLLSLPKDSVVFLTGDTFLFNARYVQYGRGIRQDVATINLYGAGRDKIFLKQKEKIASQVDKLPTDVIGLRTIASFARERPVFSTTSLNYPDKKYGALEWMPYGLFFKLITDSERPIGKDVFLEQQEKIFNSFRIPDKESREKLSTRGSTLLDIPVHYAQAYINTANHLLIRYDDFETAKAYYEKAISIAPDDEGGYKGLGYYYLQKKDCKKAEEFFNKTMFLNPSNKPTYALLYATYSACFKSPEKAKKVADRFQEIFKVPIFSQIPKDIQVKQEQK